MITLGNFVIDTEEMTMSRDGNTVKLEPKVLEVLLYLSENANRYVSMTELHEKVWAERVVSDAAVRRIIGKLRTLFQDDHKAPNYIQSLPKRGYKLICPISSTAAFPNSNNERSRSKDSKSEEKTTVAKKPYMTKEEFENIKPGLIDKILSWNNALFYALLFIVIAVFFIGPIALKIIQS